MALTPQQVEALHGKMLHKRLYIIFSEPTEKTGDRRQDLPQTYRVSIEDRTRRESCSPPAPSSMPRASRRVPA